MTDAASPAPPAFSRRVPEGEDRERSVCDRCGFVDYVNPRIVAGAVVAVADAGAPFGPGAAPLDAVRVLLCRRAIEPRRGYWTLPAGYMETGETVGEAVAREAWEEANARLALDGMLALYDIARISQVQIFWRATLAEPGVAPGPESLEVALFRWDEIPWGELAFPTVKWALDAFLDSRERDGFAPYRNPA